MKTKMDLKLVSRSPFWKKKKKNYRNWLNFITKLFLLPMFFSKMCFALWCSGIWWRYGIWISENKKYAYSPQSPLFNVERVWKLFGIADGCLVHLAGLKLKKPTLKLGKGGLCQNFCGWLCRSQKLFWQGFK